MRIHAPDFIIRQISLLVLMVVLINAGCSVDDSNSNEKALIKLSASAVSIPADGISTVTLTASISEDASKRTIRFFTDKGSFIERQTSTGSDVQTTNSLLQTQTKAETDPVTEKSVKADRSGKALATLISSNSVGTAHIEATIDGYLASTAVDFVAIADPLTLNVANPSVLADGVSSTLITATVNPGLINRTLTFVTDRGYFASLDESGARTRRLTIKTDSNGSASTIFLSSTEVGTAYIEAVIEDFHARTVVELVAISEPLALSVEQTKISANGMASTLVKVQVAEAFINKLLTLTTDRGSFGALDETGQRLHTLSMNTDSQGFAQTTLLSSRDSGIAYIEALIEGFRASTTVEFEAVTNPFSLSLEPHSIPADGLSTATITVQVEPGFRNQPLLFSTDKGFFSTRTPAVTVIPNGGGQAIVTLISGTQVGIGHISVTLKDFNTLESSLDFTRSLPESLILNASNATVAAYQSVLLTATLLRSSGQASEQAEVTFSTTGNLGLMDARVLSDSKGIATTNLFNPGGTPGGVTITAAVGEGEKRVQGSTVINFE
ncbi:hypothetical protein WDW89_03950 [Deltaproteobacteria bacterium TL4]